MANRPSGFAYRLVGNDVVISHNGCPGDHAPGAIADRFMADMEDGDPQELMARSGRRSGLD